MEITKLIMTSKTIKGCQFVRITNYHNSAGEVSDQTILVGANYMNMKERDVEKIKNADVKKFVGFYDETILKEALKQILASYTKPDEEKPPRKQVYRNVGRGIKVHIESGELYIQGWAISKDVKVKGVYKEVKSKPLTTAKRYLEKALRLRSPKFKIFPLGKAESISMNGEKLML